MKTLSNGHDARAIPDNDSREHHDRFPLPEGDVERAARDFHRKAR